MAQHLPAIVLLVVNVGLLWLLMAAPLGMRTLKLRASFTESSDRIWKAVSPTGPAASWHHAVLTTEVLSRHPLRIEQTYTHHDRHGKPISRTFDVVEREHSFESRIVEDSALDASFWQYFVERRHLHDDGHGTVLTIEQTDRYRGVAFLIFRYFALRRETRALRQWLATGQSSPVRLGFEHPLVQVALAIVSTLMLWPFFGLTRNGLLISSLLTAVIVLHELGHMAAYRAFGHGSARMIFVPLLGGIAIGGRPYNSLFEVATCALMGAGMSAFLIPVAVALHASGAGRFSGQSALVFLLILGAFNLLNLLPMNRFDGGQVLRQVFRSRTGVLLGSFCVTLIILAVGWRIGLSSQALIAGLAVFVLLSMIGAVGVKPRHKLDEMSGLQRIISALGLYAAVALHGYAIIYATDRLFS